MSKSHDVREARERLGVAAIFSRYWIERLVSAGERGDCAAIDRITDEMAHAGLVRPRSACGLFATSSAAQSRATSDS